MAEKAIRVVLEVDEVDVEPLGEKLAEKVQLEEGLGTSSGTGTATNPGDSDTDADAD